MVAKHSDTPFKKMPPGDGQRLLGYLWSHREMFKCRASIFIVNLESDGLTQDPQPLSKQAGPYICVQMRSFRFLTFDLVEFFADIGTLVGSSQKTRGPIGTKQNLVNGEDAKKLNCKPKRYPLCNTYP